jgi:hypothetical protein
MLGKAKLGDTPHVIGQLWDHSIDSTIFKTNSCSAYVLVTIMIVWTSLEDYVYKVVQKMTSSVNPETVC